MANPNLPLQPTPFVGRTDELADITALLADPACRLLTLVGPGGIGKTRLAIEAASEAQDLFPDGVWFAALQPVTSTVFLVSALADALSLAFYGQEDPRTQLLHWLRPKTLLLVADNFEHLLDDANLLTEIVETAPRVKLLVTSRERLNLREEWVRTVPAMAVPDNDHTVDLDRYDAVRLFVERARQVRGDFVPDRERQHVIRICRLVEGLPLAIELAAARMRALSCEQIAAELQHSTNVLTTSLRNVPERHRDMYVVFEPCWSRLTHTQRDVFMRLSAFRGGFTREAAEHIAGASLDMLTILGDKSLLRVTPTGRYEMHELVRQYGEAQLKEFPGEWEHVQDRHCAYYTEFLHLQEVALKGPDQIDALTRIDQEIDNVRAAWHWAVTNRRSLDITNALHSLTLFYHIRSRFVEGYHLFSIAVERFRPTKTVLLGQLILLQGWFAHFHGRCCGQPRRLLSEGVSILQEFGALDTMPVAESILLFYVQGPEDYTQLQHLYRQNLAAFRVRADPWGAAWTLMALGMLERGAQRYETAHTYLQQSAEIYRQLGSAWASVWALHGLGWLLLDMGRYEDACHYYQDSIEINREAGDVSGVLFGHLGLSLLMFKQRAYQASRHHLDQALHVFEGQGSQLGLAGHVPNLLGGLVHVLFAQGKPEKAADLLHTVLPPPITNAILDSLQQTLLSNKVSESVFTMLDTALTQHYDIKDLMTLAVTISEKLDALDCAETAQHHPSDILIDPLTPRELEVLQLVAEGWSNREIAQELVVTVGTVKKHLNNIFSKLHVRSRTQTIARARELDLLS
jgi:predicted ATPase/DNA-binding CsgD family transcriptional regulator